jgi:hypothetical protein
MNKCRAHNRNFSQYVPGGLYVDTGFKQSGKIHRNCRELERCLMGICDSLMQPAVIRQRIKEFILGVIFLAAFCFAGVDSEDFTYFILTKIVALSLFALAYVESRTLVDRKERISYNESYFEESSRRLKIGVMRFFERRNPVAYSVLFERPLRKEYVSICGAVGFSKSK